MPYACPNETTPYLQASPVVEGTTEAGRRLQLVQLPIHNIARCTTIEPLCSLHIRICTYAIHSILSSIALTLLTQSEDILPVMDPVEDVDLSLLITTSHRKPISFTGEILRQNLREGLRGR